MENLFKEELNKKLKNIVFIDLCKKIDDLDENIVSFPTPYKTQCLDYLLSVLLNLSS